MADKDKDEKIKQEIKKAGDSVKPQDKDALAKIRERTRTAGKGNGKKGGRGRG